MVRDRQIGERFFSERLHTLIRCDIYLMEYARHCPVRKLERGKSSTFIDRRINREFYYGEPIHLIRLIGYDYSM